MSASGVNKKQKITKLSLIFEVAERLSAMSSLSGVNGTAFIAVTLTTE